MKPDFALYNSETKVKKCYKALAFGASDTSKSFTFTANGLLSAVLLKIPNVTNTPTATISIVDEHGVTVYSVSGLAENTTHMLRYDSQNSATLPLKVPFAGFGTCTVLFTGAPGAYTIEVELYFT